MGYFDLSYLPNINENLKKRLGYKRIFVIGQDVFLTNTQNSTARKTIIKSSDPKRVSSALRESNNIGVLFEDNVLIKKAIEEAGNNDKLVIFSLSDLMGKDPVQTSRNMNKIKTIMIYAKKFGARMAIITLAARIEDLTSAMQAIALSELLGMDSESSKKALSAIGEYIDN